MIRAILTDIEGTTTSVRFVYEVLFPYSRVRLGDYVRAHASEPPVREQLRAVAKGLGGEADDEAVIRQLDQWADADRKEMPLKALQGMVWEAGYENGDITGHVYPDAARRLREWKAAGLDLYVYSSGSVKAQRLLFGHSDFGDLTGLFSGFFDTRTGSKRDADSYRAIAGHIGRPAEEILFLSDIREELDAAREAGMGTAWLVRDAAADPQASHPQAADFDAVMPGYPGKP